MPAKSRRSPGRASQLRILAAAICFRPLSSRQQVDVQQPRRHRRGRAACVLRLRRTIRARNAGRYLHPLAADGRNEPAWQHHDDHRPLEARRQRRERTAGIHLAGKTDGDPASRTEPGGSEADSARSAHQWPRSAGVAGACLRGRRGDVDRMREPLESPVGPPGSAAKGAGHAGGARRGPPPPASTDVDRKHRALLLRGRARAEPRHRRHTCGGTSERLQSSPARKRAHRRKRAGLHRFSRRFLPASCLACCLRCKLPH